MTDEADDAFESPNEVIPSLWLGDYTDARNFNGERLCVLEMDRGHPGSHWVPILEGPWARRTKLDEAADLISERLAAGAKLIVHCMAGIERSPLTVAWWLVKTGRKPNLDAAYYFLKARRSCVLDRQCWIEPELPSQ